MADRIPGLPSYHRAQDDEPPTTPQTVFPKSQGQPVAPDSTPPPIPDLPDYKRATPAAASPTGSTPDDSRGDGTWSSLFHDIVNPQPANLSRPQSWRDWATKTYSPSASDLGNAALDDVSFGGADYAQSRITGENLANIRARTADSQAALGPMGPVVNALTYAIPGTGEMKMVATPGKLIRSGAELADAGRYGTAAIEGGTAAALSSAGHQAGDPNGIDALKVAKDAGYGAVGGTVMQGLGDVTAPVVRNVSDYVAGNPGRGSEAWDWRTRAASGDPTLSGEVANQQVFRAPNDPAQVPLAKVQSALAQSTDPGRGFQAIQAGTALGAGALGLHEGLNLAESITPGGVAGWTTNKIGEPLARGINTIDRNINVGQALDQVYPALYPNRGASTTDTSGWANALRQGWIGGDRSTDQAGDAQWW